MSLLILYIVLCSPPLMNAEENGDDADDWDELSSIARMSDKLLNELDPFNLEVYRENSFKDDMASVTEKENQGEHNTETGRFQQTNVLDKHDNSGKVILSQFTNYEIEHKFLQRLVNMLINKCTSNDKNSSENVKKIVVKFEITQDDLKKLHDMRNVNDSPSVIRVLNNIISTMKTDNNLEDSSYISLFNKFIASTDIWWDIGVISFATIPLLLFAMGGKLMRILVFTLFLTFSMSYYATYKQMILKVKTNNERILSKPLKCNFDELAWYQTIFSFTTESECKKRWNALHVDPAVEITPVKIISHMLAVAAFQPLEQFGIMFSQFSTEVFDSQSFMCGIIVFTTAVLIIIIGMIACCYGIFQRYRTVLLEHPSHERYDVADSAQTRNLEQMFPKSISQHAPGSSYHAHPRQPIYIFTNYPNNIPINSRTDSNRAIDSHSMTKKKVPSSK